MQPSQAPEKIRLLIVEDHPTVRAGIRALLETAEDIDIVAEAGDGLQAVELAEQYAPDFILLDMELPLLRGDEVMRHVLRARPDVRVLVLSSYDDYAYIRGMLAGGARGYLLKDEASTYLLAAIRSIHSQSAGAWLSPRVTRVAAFPSAYEQKLSWRELALMEQLAENWSEADMANELNLSPAQLEEHLQVLLRKFGASSLEALTEIARRTNPPVS